MSSSSKSGIQTSADGSAYIPSSTRSDGSTRKEIRVRPGYRPPEDVETYRNRSAEAWKNRGSGGVPGAGYITSSQNSVETKSKNAKRREAAKKRQEVEAVAVGTDNDMETAMDQVNISGQVLSVVGAKQPGQTTSNPRPDEQAEADQQKKIRNQLKKLRAVRELKNKRASGEKLSPEQLMKIGKEEELLRDLKKLNYDGPEVTGGSDSNEALESTDD